MEYVIIAVLLITLFLVTLRKEEKQIVMSYSPTTVANYFIEKHSKDGELTPMKLLKLTYIAYGWYLAVTEKAKKLLNEQPVAWDYGPVFPSLYSNLKRIGDLKVKDKLPNQSLGEKITPEDEKFLEKIWSIYGKFDGVYLSALTYKEGTPWKEVYRKDCNSILSDDSIYQHYKEMLTPA